MKHYTYTMAQAKRELSGLFNELTKTKTSWEAMIECKGRLWDWLYNDVWRVNPAYETQLNDFIEKLANARYGALGR